MQKNVNVSNIINHKHKVQGYNLYPKTCELYHNSDYFMLTC